MPKSQTNSILCPSCRKLISADEPVCPYCGTSRPGSASKKIINLILSPGPEEIIRYIIWLNVAFFVISLLFSTTQISFSSNPLNFLSPSFASLLLLGATGTTPIDELNRWWTLISANYLHGGILHIFFNMMIFKQLAPTVIREFGVPRMIIIYTLGGVIGFLVSYWAGVRFTIGASAAVCGLIGALLYYGKSRGGTYGQALYKEVFGWVIGLTLFGFIVPGINNWGHGGGIAGGIITAALVGYREKRRDSYPHTFLAAALIVITISVLIFALLSAIYYLLAG